MRIEQFVMERMQSTWENRVEINLSESGVHPLRVEELARDPAEREGLLAQQLGYPQTNGTPGLRAAIAAMYPGATADHVEVTNGGSEANFVVTWKLVEPGDEVVAMLPNYMQTWGLARAFGATVREWRLRETPAGWAPDLDELAALLTRRTRLVIICNPNNPTGARLPAAFLDDVCRQASRVGAWVLSDEIYRGAELDGCEPASAWGRSDRALVTGGLSKAYGLPGLRTGWIVGPPAFVASTWEYHDYTTIAPSALSDRLARIALAPARRQEILERTRGILRRNYPVVTAWLAERADRFAFVPPAAGAIVYVRYRYPINSTVLTDRLREERGVLIVPGDQFGMDGYLRLGYGGDPDQLREGLGRLHALLEALPE